MSLNQENPVLHKELTQRFQWRRQSKANRIAITTIVGLVIPLLYYFSIRGLYSNSDTGHHDAYTIFMLALEVTLVALLSPALTAGAITIEREKQTWNALLLSRLTHREIVSGKFLGAMIPVFVMLSVFFPLNVLAAIHGKVTLYEFIVSHLMLVATALFFGAAGLFCSWACRRTQIATAASAGVVAVTVLGTYLAYTLWEMVARTDYLVRPHTESFVPLWLNPYYAMNCVLSSEGGALRTEIAFANIVFMLGGMAVFLLIVTKRLATGPKEMSA
jgi:ABC-type transport system involved in multi-copper enzyme maturation permease subunit